MSANPGSNKLLQDLQDDAASYFSGGVRNNVLDFSLSITTVGASVLAACLAVAEIKHRWVIALVAALPAAAASIQTKVDVRGRSDWYFRFAAEMRALAIELEFESEANLSTYAKRKAKLETEMEADWRKVGRHSSQELRSLKRGEARHNDR